MLTASAAIALSTGSASAQAVQLPGTLGTISVGTTSRFVVRVTQSTAAAQRKEFFPEVVLAAASRGGQVQWWLDGVRQPDITQNPGITAAQRTLTTRLPVRPATGNHTIVVRPISLPPSGSATFKFAQPVFFFGGF